MYVFILLFIKPTKYIHHHKLRGIAQELHKLNITEKHKILTLDIKDLYVNLPKQGIIQSTIFWLDKNNTSKKVKEQLIWLLKIIIEQNYFQYNDQFFKPKNGIAMGSPTSGMLAEIYLQRIEELHISHWIESKEIIYYKRYVDDIIIIFNHNKTNEIAITSIMNNINEQLEFKATMEVNKINKLLGPNNQQKHKQDRTQCIQKTNQCKYHNSIHI